MLLCVKVLTVILLLCFANFGAHAEISSGLGYGGYESGQSEQSNEYVPSDSRDLLNVLLTEPSKRQWCRKGMTYNHVLGSCTLSFAAMRSKGRRN